jgi:MFS transporter, FHS family, glucose/mannose:H+ symporter
MQARPAALPISPAAPLILQAGFALTGIVTTLLGPFLPLLISRWSLSDQSAGLYFTAQFCGSMLGVAWFSRQIRGGYGRTFVLGFSLMALGVSGFYLENYHASLAATGLFGAGLGLSISATNLWVAEISKARRVAALSILNLMWGIGAIACPPFVMFALKHAAAIYPLLAIAGLSALVALASAGMNLEPEWIDEQESHSAPPTSISRRSLFGLAALFFLYIGSENSVSGWVATLAKRLPAGPGGLWALAPMFFWAGLLGGRALIPRLPLQHRERLLFASGVTFSAFGILFPLATTRFGNIAISVAAIGLGFAGIYPILVAWLVDAFGERSRQIEAMLFVLAALGGATLPWLVGWLSTRTGSLGDGLAVPLAGCLAMLLFMASMREPVFRGKAKQ